MAAMKKSTQFLFNIIKEVKDFYETPVIFFTNKNYSEDIFNTMCYIHSEMLQAPENMNQSGIIDRIVDYHLQWLHAVNDVQYFRKIIETKKIEREKICQSINYTIDALKSRLKHFKYYIETAKKDLNQIHQFNAINDMEIVEEMHNDVVVRLSRKVAFYERCDENTMKKNILPATDELLNWLDKIYDSLSIDLSNCLELSVSHLTGDMTKTLQQIVDELQSCDTPAAQKLFKDLKEKGNELSTLVRNVATRNLEICKIVEKINTLEDRINRIEHEENTAALQALIAKKDFLEKKLESIENLKTTIRRLNKDTNVSFDEKSDDDPCDFFRLRIFNHDLPAQERERLVTELCFLWDSAVFGKKTRKSIISILSATEIKEEYTDDLGTFYIDEYTRRIYKLPGDETLYQQNEAHQLVPLTDDDKHIYFYDHCGRYYVDSVTKETIYRAVECNSEYVMDEAGALVKIKEIRDGITFYYDQSGRYYINEEGKRIYRDVDTVSEYENDGLGNLVRLRSHTDILDTCPEDVRVSEDYKYLKCVVGKPLRRCIADCIMNQPADPVKYLSNCLIKYRENMEFREQLRTEREELEIERENIRAEERAAAERAALEAALLAQGGSETSIDTNLMNYIALQADGLDSVGVVTPSTGRSNVN